MHCHPRSAFGCSHRFCRLGIGNGSLAGGQDRLQPILMADELTGNLDSVNGQHILDLLLQLNREEKTPLILVTHDPKLPEYADRIIMLKDARILTDEMAASTVGA